MMNSKIVFTVSILTLFLFPIKNFAFQLNQETLMRLNDDNYELKSVLEQLKVNSNIDDSKIYLRRIYIGDKKHFGDMRFDWIESADSPIGGYPPKFACQTEYNLSDTPHSPDINRSRDKVKCPITQNLKPLSAGKQLTPIIILVRENLKAIYETVGKHLNKKFGNLWLTSFEKTSSDFGISILEIKKTGITLNWFVNARMDQKSKSDFFCFYEIPWNQTKINPDLKINCDND